MAKRLVFSNATPNNKGGIIPNNTIRWDRFKKNPVALKNHDWESDPIGFWTSIQELNGDMSGIPVLHEITEVAEKTKKMYDQGFIRAASIGGFAIWKPDPMGRKDKDGNILPYVNPDGYTECLEFDLYEISIVTLPSNEDAVTDEAKKQAMTLSAAKCYTVEEIDKINKVADFATLSVKYNLKPMPTEEEVQAAEAAAAAAAAKPAPAKPAPAAKPEATVLTAGSDDIITMKASAMPGFLDKIIKTAATLFSGTTKLNVEPATPTDLPESRPASDAPLHVPQPGPIGLAAKAKEEMESATLAAEKAVQAAQALKAKCDADDSDDLKAQYATALKSMNDALSTASTAASNYATALKADADDDDDDDDMKADKKPSKNSAVKPIKTAATPAKPTIKTLEELQADAVKLATAPIRTRVGAAAQGRSFTELSADKEGRQILNRVMARDAGKSLADYEVVLNSIMNDGRYAAITEKMRVMMNVNESELGSLRTNPQNRGAGLNLQAIANQLANGTVEGYDRSNVMRNLTTLSSTDNALASPALNTIEWLPLAIFKLFPSTSWKNPIPMFGAQMTGSNTGIIWANVAADPTIYKGTQPVNPGNYTYSDTGVSLSLTPYWLQPMLWTPLTMHQLRYDQMATGWAQAFAKWNSVMDDNLLYQIASTVPSTSVILSSGLSGYQTQAQAFNVAGATSINNFYWNPAFNGNLLAPTLNDMLSIEQVYNQQNFPMEEMDASLVIDPIMEKFLKMDPEAKNLLTRWVNADGANLLKFSHTVFNQRSRVVIYDPATKQVKDPNGIIPATAVSCGMGFVPSQLGIGLGMLDVFMVQDPTNFGYKMSADIRVGIAPLRADFTGTSLFTYGPANV